MSEKINSEEKAVKKKFGVWKIILGFVGGFIVGALAVGIVALLIGLVISNTRIGIMTNLASQTDFLDASSIDKMNKIEMILDEYYYEDIDHKDLEEGLYYGMVEAVNDPYTVYYSEEELVSLMEDLDGNFQGIGAYLQLDQELGYAKITEFIEGGSAGESAMAVGDYVVAVDGEELYGMSLEEVVSKVKGEEGTYVTITLLSATDGSRYDVTLERRKIDTPTVKLADNGDGIFTITITEFDSITMEQFEDAFEEAKSKDMKGLIIDLRGNPGGSLETVVDIAQKILPAGLVVYTEDKYGNRQEYKCDGKNEIDVPLVLLVDGGSASASEILAGAVRDHGVGTLIGTKTFGKGVVQQIISLPDQSAVKVTVSKYFTPNGENIHKVGIEPDIEVKFDADAYLADKTDNQLDYAIEYIKQKINE